MKNNLSDWSKSRARRMVLKSISRYRLCLWMHIRYAEIRIKIGFKSPVEWKLYSN